ncbi:MAG: hypothetical protein AAF740_12265 [Bacteroidota bacterium]
MKYHILLVLTLIFCACTQSKEDDRSIEKEDTISVSTTPESEEIIEDDSLKQFWIDNKIASATLYCCYLPEAENGYGNLILDKNMELHSTVINSLTYELPRSAVDLLNKEINTESPLEMVAECFDPHHGIVLKDDAGQVIGHVSICFDCYQYYLLPKSDYHIPMKVFEDIRTQAGMPIEFKEIAKAYRNN